MLFIKKRPDLPQRPVSAKEEGFSLFVDKAVRPAQAAPAPDKAVKGLARRFGAGMFSREPKDITDVLELTLEAIPTDSGASPALRVESETPSPIADTRAGGAMPSRLDGSTSPDEGALATPTLNIRRHAAPVSATAPRTEEQAHGLSLSSLTQRFKKSAGPGIAPTVTAPVKLGLFRRAKFESQELPEQHALATTKKASMFARVPKSLSPILIPGAMKAGAAATAPRKPFFARTPQAAAQDTVAEVAEIAQKAEAENTPAKSALAAFMPKKSKASVKSPSIEVKPKTSKKASAPSGSTDILVELEGDRRVFWRVASNKLSRVEGTEVARAASFSRYDYRYLSDVPLSHNGARDLALSELGEECRVVNATKSLGAVYAATAARIDSLPCPVGSGFQLLEQLLEKNGHAEQELIAGLLLEEEGGQSLAILFHVTAQGAISAPQITVNPDNLSFTLSQFASSKRLDADVAQVVLFKNADLLAQARGLECYPVESVWNGIAVRKLVWMGVLVCAGASGATVLYASQAYLRIKLIQGRGDTLAAQVKKIDGDLQRKISGSLITFAGMQSVDVGKVTQRAAELWEPNSRVTMESTAGKEKFDLLMPFTRGSFGNNRPSVLGQLKANDVEPLIGKAPPEGCVKEIPGVTGGVNAIQITITCESPASPVSRYRLD